MISSIIPDARYQELNISFNFDQSIEDKIIIGALVDHTTYQLELFSNLEIDFEDIKSALNAKQFKIVSRSPEILKLKIAFVSFEFKNVEKMTFNALKQTITELQSTVAKLSQKLKEQSQRNNALEESIKQLRRQLDLHTKQLAQLKRASDQSKNYIINHQKEYIEFTKKVKQMIGCLEKQNKYLDERVQKLQTNKPQQNENMGRNEEKESLSEQIRKSQQQFNTQEQKVQNISEHNKAKQKGEEIQPHIITQNQQYLFSSTQKIWTLQVYQNQTKASLMDGWSGGLGLVQGTVFKKGSSIKFAIQNINAWDCICVGLGIRRIIVGNKYYFDGGKIGHGCFCLSSIEGRSYCHSQKQNNNVKTYLSFTSKDVIEVRTNDTELCFVNHISKKELRMQIKLSEEDWKDACFCVYMNFPQSNSKALVQIVK